MQRTGKNDGGRFRLPLLGQSWIYTRFPLELSTTYWAQPVTDHSISCLPGMSRCHFLGLFQAPFSLQIGLRKRLSLPHFDIRKTSKRCDSMHLGQCVHAGGEPSLFIRLNDVILPAKFEKTSKFPLLTEVLERPPFVLDLSSGRPDVQSGGVTHAWHVAVGKSGPKMV